MRRGLVVDGVDSDVLRDDIPACQIAADPTPAMFNYVATAKDNRTDQQQHKQSRQRSNSSNTKFFYLFKYVSSFPASYTTQCVNERLSE